MSQRVNPPDMRWEKTCTTVYILFELVQFTEICFALNSAPPQTPRLATRHASNWYGMSGYMPGFKATAYQFDMAWLGQLWQARQAISYWGHTMSRLTCHVQPVNSTHPNPRPPRVDVVWTYVSRFRVGWVCGGSVWVGVGWCGLGWVCTAMQRSREVWNLVVYIK